MPSDSLAAPRLVAVELDDRTVLKRNADIERELQVALADLHADNHFVPRGPYPDGYAGPFHLRMRVCEGRLALDISTAQGAPLETILVAMSPFGRTVREYFAICESYFTALRQGASQLEAIDMGRRGIHDEAATLLMERLAERVTIDHATARRLFTLICVLHLRS